MDKARTTQCAHRYGVNTKTEKKTWHFEFPKQTYTRDACIWLAPFVSGKRRDREEKKDREPYYLFDLEIF